MPFTSLRLTGAKPRVFPRGYPHSPSTLGQQIRQRRMDLGLTQHTLALRLGCIYPTVAGWESGASEPLAARWPAIEAVLGPELLPEREGLSGRLRTRRLRLGLTQAELASRASVDVRTVRNVEKAVHPPSRLTLKKLKAIIGDPLNP